MIEDNGIIVSIDKEKGVGIKVEGVEHCEVCSLKSACGQKRGEILFVPYKEGFSIGDKVKVKIYSVSLFNASLFLYLIPLFIFIIGILISYFYIFKNFSEILKGLFSFLFSVSLLLPYGFFLKYYDKKKQKNIRYELEKR